MKDQEKDLQEELQNIVNEAEAETEEPQSTEAEDTETAESKEDVKEEVKDPLEVANETIADLNDKYLRKCAEFENFRRRSIKEKAELILNGGEKVITKILPVIDDMERAIENGKKTEDVATLRDGMELIYKKFLKILEGIVARSGRREQAHPARSGQPECRIHQIFKLFTKHERFARQRFRQRHHTPASLAGKEDMAHL